MQKLHNKGFDMGPMFWIILGVLFMVAIIVVVISAKNSSVGIISTIFGGG